MSAVFAKRSNVIKIIVCVFSKVSLAPICASVKNVTIGISSL
jgi:hypothetical protein